MIRRTTRETEMLLQARWRLGLSQHQVASLIGLADRQYQRYEYGEMAIHRINLRAGLALCAVLEIDPVSLVFDGNANALKELRKQRPRKGNMKKRRQVKPLTGQDGQ